MGIQARHIALFKQGVRSAGEPIVWTRKGTGEVKEITGYFTTSPLSIPLSDSGAAEFGEERIFKIPTSEVADDDGSIPMKGEDTLSLNGQEWWVQEIRYNSTLVTVTVEKPNPQEEE